MDSLARLGMMLTCGIAIYVGVRTLLIWRRTRMIQEFCIGINVFAIAVGGLLLTILGAINSKPIEIWGGLPYALGLFGLVVHVVALYAGNWKIFRPTNRWPVPIVVLTTAGALLWMLMALTNTGVSLGARSMLLLVIRGGGMMWGAYECYHYSALLRKRAKLGLGDPMIAHRIWMWGGAAMSSLVTIGLDIGSWALNGQSLAATPTGLHIMSLFGVIGALCIALAFFPPSSYVRLIERRQANA